MIDHATGVTESGEASMNDTGRDKLAIDTYWKLVSAENRKEYGDTKTIEFSGGISITAALAQGRERAIEAKLVEDVDLLSAREIRQLEAPADDPDEDDD